MYRDEGYWEKGRESAREVRKERKTKKDSEEKFKERVVK
jgi:hypothetical protein